MFEKLLIANRGEIAVRIIKTAHSLGFTTVAVYSEADASALHVEMADEAVNIGPAAVSESYLSIDKIIAAAKLTGAQAIHPGYGFLSENALFANRCEQEGITFIGPKSEAIELMGSKRLSKIAMEKAGVPCISGYQGEDQSNAVLVKEAQRIGFPIMIKASAGGGGRGMRLVLEASELDANINTARSEAENAFGSGELILEQAVINPRHIEIQVFADKHENVVYLGDRDCSIQRRHQKVVEEAPSPFVDVQLREQMGKAAVQAARACNYIGAGTVEFLVDADKNFYFLEMNTRLQVEHPVTELITGTDLVEWQLRVACDQTLPLTQDEIALDGHAMEVRLYAEDPAHQFLPQTGPIHIWEPAQGKGIRIDSGIKSGQEISAFYDPMLAKIIAYGSDREEARRRLLRALENSTLFGLTVNTHFLHEVLKHPAFIEGKATTSFIGSEFSDNPVLSPLRPDLKFISLAAIISYLKQSPSLDYVNDLSGWSNTGHAPWPYQFKSVGALKNENYEWDITLQQDTNHFKIKCENSELEFLLVKITNNKMTYCFEGVRKSCNFYLANQQIHIQEESACYIFEDLTHSENTSKETIGSGQINATMDGSIVEVMANVGDKVTNGQTLIVLEAMKMEHPLKATVDGIVERVAVQKGEQVKLKQTLISIEADQDQAPTQS